MHPHIADQLLSAKRKRKRKKKVNETKSHYVNPELDSLLDKLDGLKQDEDQLKDASKKKNKDDDDDEKLDSDDENQKEDDKCKSKKGVSNKDDLKDKEEDSESSLPSIGSSSESSPPSTATGPFDSKNVSTNMRKTL